MTTELNTKIDINRLPEGYAVDRLEDDVTHDDYIFVEFPRTAGRAPESITEKLSDATPALLKRALKGKGAELASIDADHLSEALLAALPQSAGLLTETVGWREAGHGRFFVLPDETIGSTGQRVVVKENARRKCLGGAVSGTAKSWLDEVASAASNAPAAAVAILTALAGPLLPLSKAREGFILQLVGQSSSGKSTAIEAAASVWGNPRHIGTWNVTDRAIFERAAANSCLCLVLDDAEKAATKDADRLRRVHELTHALTSGSSREYSKAVSGQDQLPSLTFSCLTLSSSPRSLEGEFKRTDGDRVRFLEIPVASGSEGGIWVPSAGGAAPENTALLTESLINASASNYGAAGREWLRYLVKNQKTAIPRIQRLIEKFLRAVNATEGVHRRIATKIALLYAAGRMAKAAGVLNWKKDRVLAICRWALDSVVSTAFSGRVDPIKFAQGLEKVLADRKHYPLLLGDKASKLRDPEGRTNRGGISETTGQAHVRLEDLRALVAKSGADAEAENTERLLAYLGREKALLSGQSGGPTRDVRLGGKNVKRLVLDLDVLRDLWSKSRTKPTERVAESAPKAGTGAPASDSKATASSSQAKKSKPSSKTAKNRSDNPSIFNKKTSPKSP